MNAIELRDVFRVHSTPEGDAAALQGLSLTVKHGEVMTVLGPSTVTTSTSATCSDSPCNAAASPSGVECTRKTSRSSIAFMLPPPPRVRERGRASQ